MDKAAQNSKFAPAGVSVRNGPVIEDKMDMDESTTNGNAKRKARSSVGKPVIYNDEGSDDSDDSAPLVRLAGNYMSHGSELFVHFTDALSRRSVKERPRRRLRTRILRMISH
jgi:hypothetical protein